jgi:group I intron endonuclease
MFTNFLNTYFSNLNGSILNLFIAQLAYKILFYEILAYLVLACYIFSYISIFLNMPEVELLEGFSNHILNMSLIPFLTSPNLNSNPYINQIKTKINTILSNNSIKSELSNYILTRIQRDPTELVKELNLSSVLNKDHKRIFSAPLPIGFTSLFALKDLPGIYLFISKNKINSYIGSTVNLYIRCRNHYNNSINDKKKHPKLYNYVAKYNWDSMEIQILTLNINHEKQFMLNYPGLELNNEDVNLLYLLTRYELLITEQYFIDHLNPTLNIDFIVNWGGQPNKGPTGYIYSEEQRELRSISMRGREITEFTKNLHKLNMEGANFSEKTRAKMQDSAGGVKILLTQINNGEQTIYLTKSAAAKALGCSIRTITRRCEDGQLYKLNNKSYVLSYKDL